VIQEDWLWGLAGGGIIGLAGAVYLLVNGRVMGASGIIGALADGSAKGEMARERVAFILGLFLVPAGGLYVGIIYWLDLTQNAWSKQDLRENFPAGGITAVARVASATGISSITPPAEWLATRGTLSNSGQRRKSASMAAPRRSSRAGRPTAVMSRARSVGVSRVVMGVFLVRIPAQETEGALRRPVHS
jgi:hypothetical protein